MEPNVYKPRFALTARLVFALALALALPARADGQLALEGATDSLEVVTSAAGAVDYHATWANVTATALTTPGTGNGSITTATTTTVIAAPAASNWRYLRSLRLYNASNTVANTVTVRVNRSGNARVLCRATLAARESLTVESSGACTLYDASGRPKQTPDTPSGSTGYTLYFSKVATAIDAAGYHYMHAKDNGFPGAYALGSPGLSGEVLNCNTASGAAVAGAPVLPNPTGSWFLTFFGLTAAVANTYELIDLLWYNTGISVTTTTAQTINSVQWPARDANGSTAGEGVRIALYATAALGNSAAISNTTVTYTNSQGVSGRTATFSAAAGFNAPATPVIGTWMPFLLQAGDTGVQSIQSITLGTSYVSGTMSLFAYRPIDQTGVPAANFPSGSLTQRIERIPGLPIFNGTCFALSVIGGTATTAPSVYGGIVQLADR
jgi:hypothetical protein